jgi:hypothetical protein
VFAVGGYKNENTRAIRANALPKIESSIKILLEAKRPTCPMGLLLKCTGQTSFKQLVQGKQLNLILLQKMGVVGSDDIKDRECKRRRVTQRPPISYAQFKYPKWITKPDSVNGKLEWK